MIAIENAKIERFGEGMNKKWLLLGAAIGLLAGCDKDVFQLSKSEVQTAVTAKQAQKIVPEVKVVGEHGIGAGIIIRQEGEQLYIVTNGALVASKPTALVQLSHGEWAAANVHVISTAYNTALLQVSTKAVVQVPNIYEGELQQLAVYVNGSPYTIQQYEDKVAAYYIDVQEALPVGSPVMEAAQGAIVGLYFQRQQKGESQPYILPLQAIEPFIEEWLTEGMEPSVRLAQSKNLYPYIEQGDQAAVQQAIEQYGENVFAYNTDEIMLFLDTFHNYLKGAVTVQDARVMQPVVGSEALQDTLAQMVSYYAAKQAKIHFSDTVIQSIRVEGEHLLVEAQTEYLLTNAAGQEAVAYSTVLYKLWKNEQGTYQLVNLTIKE
ncbi:hypothetical protein MHB42_09860 [Lysinibacillus sp. FSL K6-0232]|uniref:TcaA NTF2-like domain-containing protein n=1 Tax=unclassified Lysinibacillus TaxID=2636778 RepID=UPI0030F843A8